jgi:hypothetical protein
VHCHHRGVHHHQHEPGEFCLGQVGRLLLLPLLLLLLLLLL